MKQSRGIWIRKITEQTYHIVFSDEQVQRLFQVEETNYLLFDAYLHNLQSESNGQPCNEHPTNSTKFLGLIGQYLDDTSYLIEAAIITMNNSRL